MVFSQELAEHEFIEAFRVFTEVTSFGSLYFYRAESAFAFLEFIAAAE